MADAKIRLRRKNGFTVVPRTIAQSDELTLAAIGLFCKMSSFPDDWEFTISDLARRSLCGRDAIRSALRNLEAAGYLLREQRHDENGHFDGNTYVLYDEKIPPLSGFPATGKPSTENPLPENPTATKDNITKEYIIPPLPPTGGARRSKEHMDHPVHLPDRFERFWAFYPQAGRKDKQLAMREWDKLKPDDALLRTIAVGLKRMMASEPWQRTPPVGIPYAGRFLRDRRWEEGLEMDTPDEEPEVYGWAQ